MLAGPQLTALQRTIGNQALIRLLKGHDRAERRFNVGDSAQHALLEQEESTPDSEGARRSDPGNVSGIGDELGVQRTLASPRFAGDPTLESIHEGTSTLSEGSEGAPVRKVQHAIHDAGILFSSFGTDSSFGRQTRQRVLQFQSSHGITTDPRGEVGQGTINELDGMFPNVALPTTAGDPYGFGEMKDVLCQWNAPLINDLQSLTVKIVGGLQWADEEFDGTGWVPNPMLGAGETAGTNIIVATNGFTNEEVARSLYHEYQHARSPRAYRSQPWAEEETRVFEMETYWAIERGITPDPTLTTTDPDTGEVEMDTAGVELTVQSYPGVDAANPGEVIGKVGTNQVQVALPNGSIITRNAVAGDSVPGPRQILPPEVAVPSSDWVC